MIGDLSIGNKDEFFHINLNVYGDNKYSQLLLVSDDTTIQQINAQF